MIESYGKIFIGRTLLVVNMEQLEESAILSTLNNLPLDVADDFADDSVENAPVTVECESCKDSHSIREGEKIRIIVAIEKNNVEIKGISCLKSNIHSLFERNLDPNQFIVIVDGYLEVNIISEPILVPTAICSRTDPSLNPYS